MKAKEALLLYSHELTGYEQAEILDYSEVFYLGSKSSKLVPRLELSNFGFDDQNSNLKLGKGDHVAFRYEVLNLLGKGSFGQVFECFDHKRLEKDALKVIRNKKRFFQQAGIEVALLSRLREKDQNDLKPVVKMKSYFLFRKHVCITFDLWNHNLYDLIRGNKHQGLTMGLVKRFVLQLLAGLNYLNTLQIIHCDLKPENILLKHPTRSEIVIIDFGSATFDNEKIHSYIQSRFYRAPEVILGIPYTTAIDMWSLGCIVFELLTGKPLFPGESEHDQLVLIIEMLGLPSAELLLQGSKVLQFFECESCELKDPCVKSVVKVPGSRKLEDVLQINNSDLTDFIRRCLDMDAKTRLTPSQAMSHPWLSPSYKGVHSSLMEKKFGKVKIIVN
jgi:dual specificity tyrosine-phosphorylation-regulated kinase 2/3/4